MEAVKEQIPISETKQAASNDPSKRMTHPQKGDTLYARLRRLERQVNAIESVVSTTRRDVYRIEKKQQRSDAVSTKEIERPVGARAANDFPDRPFW